MGAWIQSIPVRVQMSPFFYPPRPGTNTGNRFRMKWPMPGRGYSNVEKTARFPQNRVP